MANKKLSWEESWGKVDWKNVTTEQLKELIANGADPFVVGKDAKGHEGFPLNFLAWSENGSKDAYEAFLFLQYYMVIQNMSPIGALAFIDDYKDEYFSWREYRKAENKVGVPYAKYNARNTEYKDDKMPNTSVTDLHTPLKWYRWIGGGVLSSGDVETKMAHKMFREYVSKAFPKSGALLPGSFTLESKAVALDKASAKQRKAREDAVAAAAKSGKPLSKDQVQELRNAEGRARAKAYKGMLARRFGKTSSK